MKKDERIKEEEEGENKEVLREEERIKENGGRGGRN